MALGVPGTVPALGPQARLVDWFPGSPGFPVLTKRMQHVVLRLVRTRIEGCLGRVSRETRRVYETGHPTKPDAIGRGNTRLTK